MRMLSDEKCRALRLRALYFAKLPSSWQSTAMHVVISMGMACRHSEASITKLPEKQGKSGKSQRFVQAGTVLEQRRVELAAAIHIRNSEMISDQLCFEINQLSQIR